MPEAEPSPDPKPAPRLGSYVLIKALGSGGMSNVFRAIHEESGSVVAVKVLPRTLAKNVTLLQRFIREAKSAEALDHPNIVAIFDRGFDQGRHYLVLEYVEGRDMHDRVRLNGTLGPGEAVNFIREVAEGLRYAAGRGMIHRDVKPANLLMTPDGHAKIIDLGLALQIEDEDERVTRDGTTVGTVDYMAPEQARDSRQTSERSDIYSLGCTFYYLLTGSAPFPGGGLSDKLARHYKAPIPEVREHRSDVSESLSLLIRKMMEKRPENRQADYTQLIAALDSLGDPTAGGQGGAGEVLDALIVDEDDEIGLAPTESAISRAKDERVQRPPSTRDHLLTAEIVDDEDDDGPPVPPPTSRPPSSRPGPREVPSNREPAPPAEISLAELAALDADEEAGGRRPVKPSSSSSSTRRPSPSTRSMQVSPAMPASILGDVSEDDEDVEGTAGPPRRGSGDELPLKTWIAAGVLVGLSIAIIGFAASMLISMTKPEKPPEVAERAAEDGSIADPAPGPAQPIPNYRPKGPTTPKPRVPGVVTKPQPSTTPEVASAAIPVKEKVYPGDWEARLFPTNPSKAPPPSEGSRIAVRRVLVPGDEPQTSSIAAALSRAGDLVEIADSGPFFEDDCQVAGRSRLVRARGGVRPMIKIEATGNEIVKEQAAKIILGGSKPDHLVVEGIDIAVDVRDLPDHQPSLFLCQGAELTLRDCSLTILNANDPARPTRFAVFRLVDGARPNRIVLERSTIRGSIRTLVEIASARAEVVFDRSLVVGGSGPLIVVEPAERASRALYFHRSVIATRGLVLDLEGRSAPPAVRALGTTFAKIEGGSGASLFLSKAASIGNPGSGFDWSGEDNAFLGWPGWLSSGPDAPARVAGLAAVHANWPASDTSSRESAVPWPIWTLEDDIVPSRIVPLAPELQATLGQVATPHPRIKELTIGSLAHLTAPELSASLIPPFESPAARPGNPGFVPGPKPAPLPPPEPNAMGPRLRNPVVPQANGAVKPLAVNPLNLTFNVEDAPWSGDLGKYLAEKLVEGTTRATIQVKGIGVHATSPIRLPDGISIAILGESAEGAKVPMPTFYPKPDAAGRSVFEIHGGDLAIANLAFSAEKATRPRHWIMVEDGLLGVRHCRFRDPGGAAPEVGPMISFVARGTAPIGSRVGPFVSATDRPTARLKNCLIWTGGDAISADVGRGVVNLENCLVISGGPAVALVPQDVDRDRFEADLILDRCTIAVDRTSILLRPAKGGTTGPSRPWLVATRKCVFPRTQTSGAGGLLQVDPDAMARGWLFWQSFSDIYEGGHFLASSGPQPANPLPPDVKKQWFDLWGLMHTKNDQGPNPRRSETLLRYKEKPKPGKVVPGALELDPKSQRDQGVEFKDLPTVPRG